MNKSEKDVSKRLKLFIGVILALSAFFMAFSLNLFGLRSLILGSNLFDRFDFTFASFTAETTRTNSKISFILNAYKYPFGGLHLREEFSYAHDLLLDGYDEYGILGFIILVAILIFGIKGFISLIKNTPFSVEFKIAVLCIYVVILMEFCVEPILAGMHWLFCFYCFINGTIDGLNRYCYNAASVERYRQQIGD